MSETLQPPLPPPPEEEHDPRLQWPYKYLWNVLRGESIVADDEVIQEELRVSYERIILALTQFPNEKGEAANNTDNEGEEGAKDGNPATTGVGGSGTESSSAGTSAPPPPTPPPGTTTDQDQSSVSNEQKLRKRIAGHLELEESVAWDVFCGFMMFEYRGGNTSFEKLLETPRVSTDFLTDLKQYYMHERLSVLLVIQTIFGHVGEPEHKYNHIFQAVCDWVKQDGGGELTRNLVKSLDMVKNPQEEIQALHALNLFLYHMPNNGIEDFCSGFVSFRSGRRDDKVLEAEAALMFTVMNFPLMQEAEEDVPIPLRESVEKFIENNADDLLINEFNLGAVLSGFFSTCTKNQKVKKILAHTKYPYHRTFATMLHVAQSYSSENVENNRNNLCSVVLKGILFGLRALAEGFKEDKILRCGSRDDLYQLAAVLMDHSEVAALLCSDEGSVLQTTVSSAMADFPLKLKHVTNIWGSLCAANANFPNNCIPLLKDCCKMVTLLSEHVKDEDIIKEILEMHANGQNLEEPRVVAGVKLPVGTVLDHFDEDSKGLTLYWRIPDNVVVDVFAIINQQVLVPIATQLNNAVLGNIPVDQLIRWVHDPNENVWSILKFLIKYASSAPAITEALCQQYEPMTYILFKTLDFVNQWKLKSRLCNQLIDLLVSARKFGVQPWTDVYFSEIWPTRYDSNAFISDMIMGHESVAATDCEVTNAFLRSILAFFGGIDGIIQFNNELDEKLAYNSVDYVNENVFHSFTRWRFNSAKAKYQILLNCLKVYSRVFEVPLESWKTIKDECATALLASNSSLMTVLSANENEMQMSVIQPTKDNSLIPEIIYQSLSVLLKLFQFQNESIKLVDASLGSTLVQKLGRFARHRLDYKIPTLAMALLKKIAEEINMSLLSCFGSEEVAFRDLISQRLEFRSEDVNLKVSILDFLTVAAHTQPGLIQYVFMDDFLSQKIVDLPTEKDEGLALAVLCFLRALFRKGANVMKRCQNLWENVFYPVNQLQPGGRLKIITCTLNIASLELYRFGMVNTKFAAEVKALLKEDNFVRLFEMALSQHDEQGIKCVQAFKHFVSVVLHRNDMEDCFEEKMRQVVLDMVTHRFWANKAEEVSKPNSSKIMMDFMCLLMNSINNEKYIEQYLGELSVRLSKHFIEDTVGVQISTLTLTNICIKKTPGHCITDTILEHILRVISHIFDNATKIFKHVEQSSESIGPLITLAASIIVTIIKTVDAKEWQPLFHRFMIPHQIVHATHEGINKCRSEGILLELLYVMLKMAGKKECAEGLISGLIVQKVFIFVMRNTERTTKDLPDSTKWSKIYLVTLELMTQMLRTEGIFFVEHILNLWGSHGTFIMDKLNSLPSMTSGCKLNLPDYNFKMMKSLLTFCVYSLDAISAMIPFWKHWSLNSQYEHLRVMEAVFTAMQTSVNLLDQPQYLQTFVVHSHMLPQNTKGSSYLEARPTPQLLELHSKLWHVIHLSTQIYWLLRTWTDDVIESSKMLGISNQIAQSAIKALSKHEKKPHSSGGSHVHFHHHITATPNPAQITDTLERALSIFLFHGKVSLESESLTTKQKQNMMREIGSDAGTLCDGVRRVTPTHPSDLLNRLCQTLETAFNANAIRRHPYAAVPVPATTPTNLQDSTPQPHPLLSSKRKSNHPVFNLAMDTPYNPNIRTHFPSHPEKFNN